MNEFLMSWLAALAWMLVGACGLWFVQRRVRFGNDIGEALPDKPLIVPFYACGFEANAHALPPFEIENDFDEEAITRRVEVPNVVRRVRGAR